MSGLGESIKKAYRVYMDAGTRRRYKGKMATLVTVIAVIMCLYQIWEVVFGTLTPTQHYANHLTFILVLTFMVYSYSKGRNAKKMNWVDIICVLLAIFAGIWFNLNADRIAFRQPMVDPLSIIDLLVGLIFVVLSFEAARRTLGGPITLVVLAFLAYTAFGQYINGALWHRPLGFQGIIDQLAYTSNGIWGSPIAVAATFVFLFVLFGAFLSSSGCGDFFFDVANALAGRTRGGGAKIAVVASGLFGMISGSPTANAVTTGSFTIPLNKKLGYTAVFAGAVEAVAATGGSIMPPIMGSSAFLMAEVAGIPYVQICIAAAIPAFLYYASLMMMVHFEALKHGLAPMPADQVPSLRKVMKNGWFYGIPIVVLVGALLTGYSPSMTAIVGSVSIIIVSWFKKETRMGFKEIIKAMESGAKTSIQVTTACAAAGMVVAGIMSTGLGGKVTSVILGLTHGMLFPTLLMIAVICLILGMGMPVAAAYVLTAMLGVPALTQMGVSTMAAHLFVVYFSIISAITPPVAVAAYATAGIADANPNTVGWYATKLGLAAFLVPFMFAYNNSMLFTGGALAIISTIVFGFFGVTALAAGVQGYIMKPLPWWQRIVMIAAGIGMIYPGILSSIIGAVLVVLIFMLNKFSKSDITPSESGVEI